jgi:hypothetical protein
MVDSWPAPKPAVAVTIAALKSKLVALYPALYTSSLYIRSEQPPGTRPSKYIVVSLLNTDFPNPAFTVARPLVECWAESSAVAEEMAGHAVRALKNAKGQQFATGWVKSFDNIQGPLELNDPDIQDRRRYQFHGDLYLSTR